MALPVINTPTYELVVPSTKKKLKFRPFLVKEEKILLLAMEEDNEQQMTTSLKQIVNNCTFGKLEIDEMPIFDLEYIFLKIRAKSVGEISSVNILSPDDNKTYVPVEIPLDEIKVKFKKDHTNVIELTDNISVELMYPTFNFVNIIDKNVDDIEQTFDIIGKCVKRVLHGENIYEKADFTQKELNEFLESLSSKQFKKMQNFFETMPKLSYDVKFKNPKTKKDNKVTLEGLQSFFV